MPNLSTYLHTPVSKRATIGINGKINTKIADFFKDQYNIFPKPWWCHFVHFWKHFQTLKNFWKGLQTQLL